MFKKSRLLFVSVMFKKSRLLLVLVVKTRARPTTTKEMEGRTHTSSLKATISVMMLTTGVHNG
jgi:hypothetical protein